MYLSLSVFLSSSVCLIVLSSNMNRCRPTLVDPYIPEEDISSMGKRLSHENLE